MEQVSINLPKELYESLKVEAGNVPVEHYVRLLISRARNQRAGLVMVEDVDSFINALQPWQGLTAGHKFTTYGGVNGGNFRSLPDGRVKVAMEAWFLALGPRLQGRMDIGELSDRFSRDGKPDATLIPRAIQTVVPWEKVSPGEAPLSDGDKAVFDTLQDAQDRIWPELGKLGVQRRGRLIAASEG